MNQTQKNIQSKERKKCMKVLPRVGEHGTTYKLRKKKKDVNASEFK